MTANPNIDRLREFILAENEECRGEYHPAQADVCDSCAALAALDALAAELDTANERAEKERKARKATEKVNAEQVLLARENWHARVESLEAELDTAIRERNEARETADGMARAPYGEFEAMRSRAERAEAALAEALAALRGVNAMVVESTLVKEAGKQIADWSTVDAGVGSGKLNRWKKSLEAQAVAEAPFA